MKKQQLDHENPNFSSLSLELHLQILDCLPDSGDRKSFRLVSRAFCQVEAVHRRSVKILRREFLTPLLRKYRSIELLDLSLCPSFPDEGLVACSGMVCNLRRIDLSRASGVGWRGLEALVGSCPRLESVDLSHCVGVGDREAAAISKAKGLKEVNFDKCLKVTDVGLAKVAVRCGRRLERLGLKWCKEISDIGIELLVKKCTELKVLDISYLKVTNKSLHSISSLEKLEVLSMVGCSHIDNKGLKSLNNGSNSLRDDNNYSLTILYSAHLGQQILKILFIDVSRCDNVTSSGLIPVIEGHKSIQNLNIGNCFPKLASFFLSKLSLLKMTLNTLKLDGFGSSTSSLQAIGLNCKNLTEISLSKCHGVNDEGICGLVSNCIDLISIDLTCCQNLTDKALSAISNHCQKLECLWLESCTLITEKGINQIATFCTNLKELDLTDCNINDAALKCLSKCSKLMVLKLGLCSSITSEGIAHIGLNCRNLQELDLYRCTRVGNDGLSSIAIGCKKLKKLNLCYCNEITDQGMKQLSSLKELSVLEIRALRHVTSLGVAAIAMGCNSLTELDVKRCYSIDDVAMCALAQCSQNIRQINISYCSVTSFGLCKLLGSLRCLQDADLVHVKKVSVEGFELALRASCGRLKKLKLVRGLLVSPGLLQILQAQGCRMRWVKKPFVLGE